MNMKRRIASLAVVIAMAATVMIAGPAAAASVKPAAGEIGISAKQIKIAVVADVDTPLSPGVFQAQVDAMRGYERYVNAHGGIAGRKLVVDFIDSKLNPDETRTRSSRRVATTSRWLAPRRCSSRTRTT